MSTTHAVLKAKLELTNGQVVGPTLVLEKMNTLGMDVLCGQSWLDCFGKWEIANPQVFAPLHCALARVTLLQMIEPLPNSQVVNTPQYWIPPEARKLVKEFIKDLERQGIIKKIPSPFNSPVWPVRKSNGAWRLPVDYGKLNAATQLLTTAIPSLLEISDQLNAAGFKGVAFFDVKDVFLMVLLSPQDQEKFAFTWEGMQYTLPQLPQRYKHSPTLAHAQVAKVLEEVTMPAGVTLLQYIDDILIGETMNNMYRKEAVL